MAEPLVPVEFSFCRSISHSWKNGKGISIDDAGMPTLVLTCINCKCTRTDHVNPSNGEIVGRQYRHPDGYLLEGVGDDRPAKSDFRREFIKRYISTKRGG